MSDATTRVLLADDHALLLDGLRRMIERVEDFEVVATVETGRAAVEAVRDFEPDVVLLDLALPELNGIDACEKIKNRHPDVAVMILSGYAQEVQSWRRQRRSVRRPVGLFAVRRRER